METNLQEAYFLRDSRDYEHIFDRKEFQKSTVRKLRSAEPEILQRTRREKERKTTSDCTQPRKVSKFQKFYFIPFSVSINGQINSCDPR